MPTDQDTASGAPAGAIFSVLQRSFGDAEMEDIFSERSTVEGWLRAEAALARAQAQVGQIEPSRAEAIAGACRVGGLDLPALWAATAEVGYPILPLIRQLGARLAPQDRDSLHRGATTQDIMDTGLSLQLASSLDRLIALTSGLGDALATQVEAHAGTVMAGRTHGQQAVPTTFGAKLATYLRQCERLRRDLVAARATICAVSLHGAAGTSAALGSQAAAVRAGMAALLGLTEAEGPWHVTRDGMAAFGATCGRAAAICARLAREVIDLSRTEIGEVSEGAGDGAMRGASSTMPQKANPIDSEAILGMAANVVATASVLYRAMEAGHERAAGEWHMEWHAIPQVAVLTAGCLNGATRLAGRLVVSPDRMAINLAREDGRTLAEAYVFALAPALGREPAHDLVRRAVETSRRDGVGLHAALVTEAGEGLAISELAPEGYLGLAQEEAIAAAAAWRDEAS